MFWLQPLVTIFSILHVIEGTSLKCGEDIVVKRGAKKTLHFWTSDEDDLMKVEIVPHRNDPSALFDLFKNTNLKAGDGKPLDAAGDSILQSVPSSSINQEFKTAELLVPLSQSNVLLQPESRINNGDILDEEMLLKKTRRPDDDTKDHSHIDRIDINSMNGGSLMTQNSDDLFSSEAGTLNVLQNQLLQKSQSDTLATVDEDNANQINKNDSDQLTETTEIKLESTTASEDLEKKLENSMENGEKEIQIPLFVLQKIKHTPSSINKSNLEGQQNESNLEGQNNESNIDRQQNDSNVEGQQNESNLEGQQNESNVEKQQNESNLEGQQYESNVEKQQNEINLEGQQNESNVDEQQNKNNLEGQQNDSNVERQQNEIDLEELQNESNVEGLPNESNVERQQNENNLEGQENESNVEGQQNESNVDEQQNESDLEEQQNESNVEEQQNESNVEGLPNESNVERQQNENNLEGQEYESNVEGLQNESNVEKLQNESNLEGQQYENYKDEQKNENNLERQRNESNLEGQQNESNLEEQQNESNVDEQKNKNNLERQQNDSNVEKQQNESTLKGQQNESNVEKQQNESNLEKQQNESNVDEQQNKNNLERQQIDSTVEKQQNESNLKGQQNESNVDEQQNESNVEEQQNESNVELLQNDSDTERQQNENHVDEQQNESDLDGQQNESNVKEQQNESNVEGLPNESNVERQQNENNLEGQENESNLEGQQSENNLERQQNESNLEGQQNESNVEKQQNESNLEGQQNDSNVDEQQNENNSEGQENDSIVEKQQSESNVEKQQSESNLEGQQNESTVQRQQNESYVEGQQSTSIPTEAASEAENLTTEQTMVLTTFSDLKASLNELSTMIKNTSSSESEQTHENSISITNAIVKLIENSMSKEKPSSQNDIDEVAAMKNPKIEDLIDIDALKQQMDQVNGVESVTASETLNKEQTTMPSTDVDSTLILKEKNEIELLEVDNKLNEAAMRQKISDILANLSSQKSSGQIDDSSGPIEIYPEDIGFKEIESSNKPLPEKDESQLLSKLNLTFNSTKEKITNDLTSETTTMFSPYETKVPLTVHSYVEREEVATATTVDPSAEEKLFDQTKPEEIELAVSTELPIAEELSSEDQSVVSDIKKYKLEPLNQINEQTFTESITTVEYKEFGIIREQEQKFNFTDNTLTTTLQPISSNLISLSAKLEPFPNNDVIGTTDILYDSTTEGFESHTFSINNIKVMEEQEDNVKTSKEQLVPTSLKTDEDTTTMKESTAVTKIESIYQTQDATTVISDFTSESPSSKWQDQLLEIHLLEKHKQEFDIMKQNNKLDDSSIDSTTIVPGVEATIKYNFEEKIQENEAVSTTKNPPNKLNQLYNGERSDLESKEHLIDEVTEKQFPEKLIEEDSYFTTESPSLLTTDASEIQYYETVPQESSTDRKVMEDDSVFSKETGSDNVLTLIRNAIRKNVNDIIKDKANQNSITIPFTLPKVQTILYKNPVVIKEHQSKVAISTPYSVSSEDKMSHETTFQDTVTERTLSQERENSTKSSVKIIESSQIKSHNTGNKINDPIDEEIMSTLSEDLSTTMISTTEVNLDITQSPEVIQVSMTSFNWSDSSSNNLEASTVSSAFIPEVMSEHETTSPVEESGVTSKSNVYYYDNGSEGKLTQEGKRDNNFLNLLEKYIIDDSPSESFIPEEIYNTHTGLNEHVNNPNDQYLNENHNYGNVNRRIDVGEGNMPHSNEFYSGQNAFQRVHDNLPPSDIYEGDRNPRPSLSSLLQTRKGYIGSREPSSNPESSLRKDDSQYPYGGDSPFFIKLPGSPNAVPVFLQYEPVKINYVNADEMATHKANIQTNEKTSSLRNEVIPNDFDYASTNDETNTDNLHKRPDPFFLMDPPDLGGTDDDDELSLPKEQSNYNIPKVKESFSVNMKTQLNLNAKDGEIPSTIVGNKKVYPGEYFLKNPDTSYSSADTDSLSNHVFSLGSQVTRAPDIDNNPQYTPFPLTTNPPRTKIPVTSTASSTTTVLKTENETLPVDTVKVTEATIVVTSTSTTETSSNSSTPSILFSTVPYIDYNSTFDAVAYPDLPSEQRTVDDYPVLYEDGPIYDGQTEVLKPHAAKIHTNELFGSPASDIALTKDEEFDIVALANFLHQNQKAWTNSNNSPLPESGAWRGPSWETMKYSTTNGNKDWKSPLGDSPWLENDGTATNSERDYSAFYAPEDIPGLDPLYFSYRQMPIDTLRESRRLKGLKSYIDSLPLPMKNAVVGNQKAVRLTKRSVPTGEKIYCEWNFKTEPGLYLLVTFHNLSAPFSVDCFGAYIEVERESNGYGARWCGNKASLTGTRQHVIFAKHQVRISVFDDGEIRENHPTGFEAEIEAIDLFDSEDYRKFIQTKANSRIRRLMQG